MALQLRKKTASKMTLPPGEKWNPTVITVFSQSLRCISQNPNHSLKTLRTILKKQFFITLFHPCKRTSNTCFKTHNLSVSTSLLPNGQHLQSLCKCKASASIFAVNTKICQTHEYEKAYLTCLLQSATVSLGLQSPLPVRPQHINITSDVLPFKAQSENALLRPWFITWSTTVVCISSEIFPHLCRPLPPLPCSSSPPA